MWNEDILIEQFDLGRLIVLMMLKTLALISRPSPSFTTGVCWPQTAPHTHTAAHTLWEFNLTYCDNIFCCWFRYWEAKKTNIKPIFLPLSQAQLHSRHISSPLVISTGYTQTLWWDNEWQRGSGSGCSGFSLLLLVSHPFLPLLLPSCLFPLIQHGPSVGYSPFRGVPAQSWSTSNTFDRVVHSFPCFYPCCLVPSLSPVVFPPRFVSSPLAFSAFSSVCFHRGAAHMADELCFGTRWVHCRASWNWLWPEHDSPDLLHKGHPAVSWPG